jgi:hypothetical protein
MAFRGMYMSALSGCWREDDRPEGSVGDVGELGSCICINSSLPIGEEWKGLEPIAWRLSNERK